MNLDQTAGLCKQLQAFDWRRVDPGWCPDQGWQPTRVHVNDPKMQLIVAIQVCRGKWRSELELLTQPLQKGGHCIVSEFL